MLVVGTLVEVTVRSIRTGKCDNHTERGKLHVLAGRNELGVEVIHRRRRVRVFAAVVVPLMEAAAENGLLSRAADRRNIRRSS